MDKPQYILIESRYQIHGTLRTTYGIAYTNCAVILEAIPDLSENKDRVQRLAALCTKWELSPIHLRDLIDDFLAQ